MPAKPAGHGDAHKSGSKKLKKSQSLPSLAPVQRSPLEVPQHLCTVDVRTRRVERTTVTAGSTKQLPQCRLPFATFERGVEWERSHVQAKMPSRRLPPLQDVMRMAMKELNIKLPSKKREHRSRKKEEQEKSTLVAYSPYLGGPRLPMRGRVVDIAPACPVKIEVMAADEEQSPSTAPEEEKSRLPGLGPAAGEANVGSQDAQAEDAAEEQAAAKPLAVFSPDDLPFPWDQDEMRSAFSRFDQDRDGELHTEELPMLLRFLGARPQPGDVESIVKDQTRYATMSWEEVREFLQRFRRLDVIRMHEQFMAADKDGSGELDFNELHLLLQEMGYYPTPQTTMEALAALDKDKSSNIAFNEFEGLREHLRVTEGFTKADYAEIVHLHSKSAMSKVGPQEAVEEVWRLTMYLGYSAHLELIRRLCDQVNPERPSGITAGELLKIVRLVRETETEDMVTVMAQYGDIPDKLPCEDLGLALTDLGYYVSEDAVNEILESMGECQSEEFVTLEEFGAFLRAYRRIEGFTEEELAELQDVFNREGRLQPGALRTLEVGKVLRWFGFALTVQEVNNLVEDIDLDGSGVLEFTEFVKLMRRLFQDEAERRQPIFQELATTSVSGVLEVHVSKLEEAVAILAGADPDPKIIEKTTQSFINEVHGPPAPGEPEDSEKRKIVFVNKPGFEAWFRHYRRMMIEDIRASAGYSIGEKACLQELFNGYDLDGSGTIERGELMNLIAEYFPDSTKSKEGQRDVLKALEEVDQDVAGELDFMKFLLLTRKVDDLRDSRDLQLEVEVVKECGFTRDEVDGFRQVFSAHVNWMGELDLPTLAEILSRVVDLSEDDVRNLVNLVIELHPQGREVARFPQFLRLLKRLTDENYGHLNQQAERFVKRQQQQHAS
mmetsp:Transcript_13162/g.42050  ORF Transcript_13162/g.42050 Transcript_13162/m.42050 type:complete len:891 (-) Transcript_13162:16-2688(-)